MKDIFMLISSVLFGILFSYLIFIFSVFIASNFLKRKSGDFSPKISIVIPAYNEEKNIKECIDSVFESDYRKDKIEVIVVDDGSTDNTLNIAKRYPNITTWVQDGTIEIGHGDWGRPFISVYDEGGTVWEGKHNYASLDEALHSFPASHGEIVTVQISPSPPSQTPFPQTGFAIISEQVVQTQ